MSEVVTCTPSSSRSNGARRRVMTSQRRPTCAAATRNLTGALSRETLLPERRLPVSVPFATTPLAVARKLVIFALIESVDDGAALADAGTANAAAATSAASVMVWDRMPAGTRKQTPQVPSSRHPCPSDRSSRAQAEARTPARRRPRTGSDVWHAKPRRRVRRRARGTPVWSVQACQSGPTDGLRHQGLERLRGRDRWRRRCAGRPALRRRLRQQRVVLVVRGAPRPCRSALVLFVVPLVTGILVLIPGQSTTALGIEVAASGALVGRVFLMLGSAELKHEPRAIVLIDRTSPRLLTTLALLACGASLIAGRLGGLYWLAGAHLGALLAGLLNAWVFLLVAGAHKDE